MMTSEVVDISPLREDEVSIVFEWAADLSWGLSMTMTYTILTIDPNGFLAARNKRGELLGCICGYKLTSDYANITYFIVKEEFRKSGIGSLLWDRCMEHLSGCVVCLYAEEAVAPIYRRRGFNSFASYSLIWNRIRYDHRIAAPTLQNGVHCVNLSDDNFPSLIDYDAKINGSAREKLIKLWTTNEKTLVALLDGKIVGYGCMHAVKPDLCYFGPLFCNSDSIASTLLHAFLHTVSLNMSIVIIFPKTNEFMMKFHDEFPSVEGVFDLPLMFLGEPPILKNDWKQVYCVTAIGYCML